MGGGDIYIYIYKFLLGDTTFMRSFVSCVCVCKCVCVCVLGGSLFSRHVVSYLTSLNEFLSFHWETSEPMGND